MMDRRTVLKGGIVLAATAHTTAFALSEIDLLVARFNAANAAWLATGDVNGDVEAEGPEYEAAWKACKDIILHKCRTAQEVQEKLNAVLADQWLCETSECGKDEELGWLHRHFLRSLII